jgi:hypothetical protein
MDYARLINLVLHIDRVVEITGRRAGMNEGRCIACQEKGFLLFRHGILWRPRQQSEMNLIHLHHCPVNRYLINQKHG